MSGKARITAHVWKSTEAGACEMCVKSDHTLEEDPKERRAADRAAVARGAWLGDSIFAATYESTTQYVNAG